MAIVSIGPHLMKNGMTGLEAADLEHAGYTLELSSDEFVLNAPLYRRIHHWQTDVIHLADYFVCSDQIPFCLTPVAKSQEIDSPIGTMVSLESLLCSLYVKQEVKRPITSVLKEFRDHLSVNHCYYPRLENGVRLVTPALAELGFEVVKFSTYGRTLSVQFGWVCPQDRQNPEVKLHHYAGMIEFKPKPDRTLGKGEWIIPGEATIAYLFTEILEAKGRKGLLSAVGIQAAIDSFKWTKVTLLTNQEARQARIDFVRAHPQLHNDPHLLAKALKKAELYSDTTEIYAIKKQLPRLIQEAAG